MIYVLTRSGKLRIVDNVRIIDYIRGDGTQYSIAYAPGNAYRIVARGADYPLWAAYSTPIERIEVPEGFEPIQPIRKFRS